MTSSFKLNYEISINMQCVKLDTIPALRPTWDFCTSDVKSFFFSGAGGINRAHKDHVHVHVIRAHGAEPRTGSETT